jgi:hypothetical protein
MGYSPAIDKAQAYLQILSTTMLSLGFAIHHIDWEIIDGSGWASSQPTDSRRRRPARVHRSDCVPAT